MPLLLGVFLLAGVIAFLLQDETTGQAIKRLTAVTLVIVVFAKVLGFLIKASTNFLLFKPFAKRLTFLEILTVTAAAALGGHVVPLGGFGTMAAWLNHTHQISPVVLTGATATKAAIKLTAGGAWAVGVAAVLLSGDSDAGWGWVPLTLAIMATGVLILLAPRFFARVAGALKLEKLAASLSALKWRWQTLSFVLGLALCHGVTEMLVAGFLVVDLTGESDAFLKGALITALATPLKVVNLTPSNLGTMEIFQGMLSAPLALPMTVMPMAILVKRTFGLPITLTFLILARTFHRVGLARARHNGARGK
jgi:uncharacterized membrane protein YbhN (UPF0104 family)